MATPIWVSRSTFTFFLSARARAQLRRLRLGDNDAGENPPAIIQRFRSGCGALRRIWKRIRIRIERQMRVQFRSGWAKAERSCASHSPPTSIIWTPTGLCCFSRSICPSRSRSRRRYVLTTHTEEETFFVLRHFHGDEPAAPTDLQVALRLFFKVK